MGAGLIPFCVRDGRVLFLFQKTFSGRKAGHFVDFGGGGDVGETHAQTAMREFVEETETMFFSRDITAASRTPEGVQAQMPVLVELFNRTQADHPDWWCQRDAPDSPRPKDWRTYFVEFEFRDLTAMNRAWELDDGTRFKKRRELHWVRGEELCAIYETAPERLWKRVRQLRHGKETVRSIMRCMGDET